MGKRRNGRAAVIVVACGGLAWLGACVPEASPLGSGEPEDAGAQTPPASVGGGSKLDARASGALDAERPLSSDGGGAPPSNGGALDGGSKPPTQDAGRDLGVPDSGPASKQTCRPPASPETASKTLTATGCVDPKSPKKPAPSLTPYEVNSPLWSDGAAKQRFIALPDGAKVHVLDCKKEPAACAGGVFTGVDGHWNFPVGTVLVKVFSFGDTNVETRLFVRQDKETWVGYSYEWNQEQTEATLLADERKTKTFQVKEGTATRMQEWNYPSRQDCMTCHTEYAGFSLGPETAQLNRELTDNGVKVNQVDKLERLGLLDAPITRPLLAPYPPPSATSGTVTERARSYLHANCAYCHRPDGKFPRIDLRWATSFKAMNVCNQLPAKGDLGVTTAKLLAPGKPEASVLVLRMKDLSLGRMPQLGTFRVDSSGVSVLEQWIRSINACP